MTLSQLIESYFRKHKLPYEVMYTPLPGPTSGIKKKGSVGWLGWIYDAEFRSYNHGDKKAPNGVIQHIHASDTEFFPKLMKWLPKCAAMWERYVDPFQQKQENESKTV